SPSGETKLPEQPPARRTEASCASWSHCASGANPYFCFTFFDGKLSNVHMPSSPRAAKPRTRTHSAATRFIVEVSSASGRRFLPACRPPVKARASGRRAGGLRRRDPTQQRGDARDLQRQLRLAQPVCREVTLGAAVWGELCIAAVKRRSSPDGVAELLPRHVRGAEVDLRRFQVPSRPGELCPVVQDEIFAP